jgi:hypothetical protein
MINDLVPKYARPVLRKNYAAPFFNVKTQGDQLAPTAFFSFSGKIPIDFSELDILFCPVKCPDPFFPRRIPGKSEWLGEPRFLLILV